MPAEPSVAALRTLLRRPVGGSHGSSGRQAQPSLPRGGRRLEQPPHDTAAVPDEKPGSS